MGSSLIIIRSIVLSSQSHVLLWVNDKQWKLAKEFVLREVNLMLLLRAQFDFT